MNVLWTPEAVDDLERLYDILVAYNPDAALRVVASLRNAADQLAIHPRLGIRLEGFGESEVRRLVVGNYEMRYRIAGEAVQILRFFHTRENR